MELSDKQKIMLTEMRSHLGELHDKWQNDPDYDGHCKSNEGYVGILFRLNNWFESESDKEKYINAKPELSMVEVYSYLFGPKRLHIFETIEEAHAEVMKW